MSCCRVSPAVARLSLRQWLAADRVHRRLVDRAMEFACPARMPIVLMPAKSVDEDTCVAGLLEGTEQRGLKACLLGAEGEVSFRLQALDQELHKRRRVFTNADWRVRDDQMKVAPPLSKTRPGEMGHGLQNARASVKAPSRCKFF